MKSSVLIDPDNDKPTFSNDMADFWLDRSLTDYVRHDRMGDPIKKHEEWCVFLARLKADGQLNYVLYDGIGFIAETPPQIDVMAVRCDMFIAIAMEGQLQ